MAYHTNQCLTLLQAEDWISERMQKLEDPSIQDPSNLQDKMKLLQKHQVFEAEILANEEIITAVNEVSLTLLVFLQIIASKPKKDG